MKFLLSVILIAILSAAAEYFLPWWTIAVICFIASLLIKQNGGRAFLMGFAGVCILWLVAAMLHDVANEDILSTRMAVLFHLPNYTLFICVTVLVGGLVGGLAAWAAALLRPRSQLTKK